MVSGRARVALAMFAVGVLAFLFAEVLVHGFELVEEAVEGYAEGEQGIGEGIGLLSLFAAGFAAGTAGSLCSSAGCGLAAASRACPAALPTR